MMKTLGTVSLGVLLVLAAAVLVGGCCCGDESCPFAAKKPKVIKAVVVTGGHGFEHDPFLAVFEGHEDIKATEFALKDHSEIFEDIDGWDYDAIVFYNMSKTISLKRRANFLALLEDGVGVVALHHSMGNWPDWEQYPKIIGTKYCLTEVEIDGVKHDASSYKHGVDMPIQIADAKHPITCCMEDFVIHDETYKDCWHADDNHVLLTCTEPTSDKTVGWTRTFGKARVCTLQLGHDSKAYSNPNFPRLVANAIRWTAGTLK